MPPAGADAAGLGLVDGWRGEVLSFVRFDAAGCIARFFPRSAFFLFRNLSAIVGERLANLVEPAAPPAFRPGKIDLEPD